MKSKVIEGEMGRGKVWRLEGTGHGYGHDTPRPPSLSLSRSWLQFDSEGLRRWIPRRPSLERGEEGGKSRTE